MMGGMVGIATRPRFLWRSGIGESRIRRQFRRGGMNTTPPLPIPFARFTPRGLNDAAYLALYREALALVESGQVSRIEEVLIDWAPSHISNFHALHLRSTT